MSDHLDAHGLKPLNMDARVDICDIYAFQKPEDTNNSILVLLARESQKMTLLSRSES